MKKLYFECLHGISGDMSVGALLDLGAREDVLRNALDSIPAKGFHVEIKRVKKASLDVMDFAVILDEEHENHDHDMEYLHGHDHHEHEHHQHEHHHEHRGLKEILHLIDHVDMSDHAKAIAKKIFQIVAEAEAKAHGTSLEEVHFHEVGAIDSIVDIVAFAVCFDDLGIEDVIISPLCEGTGTIRCQHGILPIPVPATANIVSSYHLPLTITDIKGELVTPTGAAITAAIRKETDLPRSFTIDKIGYGAGKRNYEVPSILRVMIIDDQMAGEDHIWKLESNIDDCSGEALGHVMEQLLKQGARDVHYIPVFMKKNRPAYQLNVICDEKDISKLEGIIFRETTTIGIRKVAMKRTILKRENQHIKTSLGDVDVKVCHFENETYHYPEYESINRLCNKHELSYSEVYQSIMEELKDHK